MAEIRYGKTEDAYDSYPDFLKQLIKKNGFGAILDVGGGAQPMFSVEYIASQNLRYTVLDISAEELACIPKKYSKCLMDIAAVDASFTEQFDFVFSRFVAEHVDNAAQLHKNVFKALRPGGMAVHFFPTLYAFPFVVNWLLPNWTAALLLTKERRDKGKFPAFYKWCIGPSARGIERFTDIGYEVVEYAGFFGHGYYDKWSHLRKLHGWFRGKLLQRPIPMLTSFAWVILRKP